MTRISPWVQAHVGARTRGGFNLTSQRSLRLVSELTHIVLSRTIRLQLRLVSGPRVPNTPMDHASQASPYPSNSESQKVIYVCGVINSECVGKSHDPNSLNLRPPTFSHGPLYFSRTRPTPKTQSKHFAQLSRLHTSPPRKPSHIMASALMSLIPQTPGLLPQWLLLVRTPIQSHQQ
jgi:hypothetical protein